MNNILKAAALLAALVSGSANATTFDFSYTFDDTSTITGSLKGDLSGLYVDNISDVHAFLNGNEFAGGSLFHAAWNTATESFDNSIGALVSTDAALNNFIFADANVPTDFGVSNYFYFINDPASLGHEIFATNLNTGDIALDNPSNGTWSLVAVPTPATLSLLVLGLGLLAVTRRQGGRPM